MSAFRAQSSAAPLKRQAGAGASECATIPRSIERGPVEAPQPARAAC